MTKSDQPRALVTGATGFIGRQLVHGLKAAGWDVHIVVRQTSDTSELRYLRPGTFHNYNSTVSCLIEACHKAKPSVVFHLASLFMASHSPEDIEPLFCSNLLFGTQLAEAMVQAGVRKMINTGTSWQHFENRAYGPVNLYAATKQAFEDILQYYIDAFGFRVITLSLFDIYGPGDWRPKLFSLLHRAAAGERLAMSPGLQLIDLVHIDDVVRAFLLAGERLLQADVAIHEHYVVSSGRSIRLRELVDLYESVLGRSLPIEWGAKPYREREVMQPWTGGRTLPGWIPRVDLRTGIARCLSVNQKATLKKDPLIPHS